MLSHIVSHLLGPFPIFIGSFIIFTIINILYHALIEFLCQYKLSNIILGTLLVVSPWLLMFSIASVVSEITK